MSEASHQSDSPVFRPSDDSKPSQFVGQKVRWKSDKSPTEVRKPVERGVDQ